MNARRWRHRLQSNVRRSTPFAYIGSISLIEVSPPHAKHSPSTPVGAELGACTSWYPFDLAPRTDEDFQNQLRSILTFFV
jgi:hypothetical protein